MWKEVISLEEKKEAARLRDIYGCARGFTPRHIEHMKEKNNDCHFYKYHSNKIELVLGFMIKEDYYYIAAYTIKADAKDYPEALRQMAIKKKEFVVNRKIKKMIMAFGFEDEEQLNFHNRGVGKLGVVKVIELAKPEYRKVGINIDFNAKQIVFELI